MKSNKPTRDCNKVIPNAQETFCKHVEQMIKKNKAFWEILNKNNSMECSALPYQRDARKIPVDSASVSLVISSPPYVTSYEYADLHQLSAIWFGYTENLTDFRKDFIGTSQNGRENIIIGSKIGEKIVEELKEKKTGKDREVGKYFSDMREVFVEMHRYLKKQGKSCIVIGNTAFRKIPILNAEVFVEQMLNIGFDIHKIIKRRICSKILPQTRDPITGKFTSSKNSEKQLAYPYEYIIIMEKI